MSSSLLSGGDTVVLARVPRSGSGVGRVGLDIIDFERQLTLIAVQAHVEMAKVVPPFPPAVTPG